MFRKFGLDANRALVTFAKMLENERDQKPILPHELGQLTR
jgi:hypothetical protein